MTKIIEVILQKEAPQIHKLYDLVSALVRGYQSSRPVSTRPLSSRPEELTVGRVDSGRVDCRTK